MTIKSIFAGLGILTLSACSHISSIPVEEEGRWIIADIAEKPTLMQHTPWLSFNNGEVQGHSGCNRFFGRYQIQANRIAFGPIGSTRKACPGPEMKQESALFKLLTTKMDMAEKNGEIFMYLGRTQVLHLISEPERIEQPIKPPQQTQPVEK